MVRQGTCPFVLKYRPLVEAVVARTRERRRLKNVATQCLARMQIAWSVDAELRYLRAREELMQTMKDLGSPL